MGATFQKPWLAESLQIELRALNRKRWLEEEQNSLLRGHETWPNQQHERFAEEMADAQSLGILPLSPEDPQFDKLMKSGERFNWAVRPDGSLRVSQSVVMTEDGPARISHAILANGGAMFWPLVRDARVIFCLTRLDIIRTRILFCRRSEEHLSR